MVFIDQASTSVHNFLLDAIARALQVTAAQFEKAKSHYEAVTEWLEKDGSPLARHRPIIYPQGSAAIGTTVRPYRQIEYDVDLVLLLHTAEGEPAHLYDLVRRRLASHGTYVDILKPLPRCLRLDYAGDFHLDVLPARPHRQGGTLILIPDRELEQWLASNPLGYADWFLEIAKGSHRTAYREAQPLPEPTDPDERRPLQRAVQLVKRRRDLYFESKDWAPSSIVLTTLVAQAYENQRTVLDALRGTVRGIEARIAITPGVMRVPNPSLAGDDLANWNAAQFELFKTFIRDFRREIDELFSLQGVERISAHLKELFGRDPTGRAVRALGEHYESARNAGTLRVGAAGLSTAAVPGTRRSPSHRFFGDGP